MPEQYSLSSASPPPLRLAVVIPLYNALPWIARSVRSVLDQDCPGVHVFVVDDGSTDGSLSALAPFGAKITVETGPNRGACHARNRGLAMAEAQGAEFVLFLDADDYLEGQMLAGALAEAEAHKADMVLSNVHTEYADGTRKLRPLYSGDVAPEDFFRGWISERGHVNPAGLLWRVSLVRRVGGWDESLIRLQDLDITLRALLTRPRIRKNEKGAAIYSQVNAGSITRDQSERAMESRYRAIAGLIGPVEGTSFETMLRLIYDELYRVARAAFRQGYLGLGREILALLVQQGYHEHPGTPLHRLAARLLGLEMKVRLWGG
jgi:glycosyltransferase involved in cell wall biosynthesis